MMSDCDHCLDGNDCICNPMPPPARTALVEPPTLVSVLREIRDEMRRAEKWPAMNSAHEGYAVLLEEVDELKAHVFANQKRRDLAAMRAEAVQVAAMAARFIRDVCDGGRGRV